jgi:hypothetical protein
VSNCISLHYYWEYSCRASRGISSHRQSLLANIIHILILHNIIRIQNRGPTLHLHMIVLYYMVTRKSTSTVKLFSVSCLWLSAVWTLIQKLFESSKRMISIRQLQNAILNVRNIRNGITTIWYGGPPPHLT